MQSLFRLRNPVQNYAWGSHTAIADLLGRPSPTPNPQAELWIGAHPRGKSIAIAQIGEIPLDKLISGGSTAILGKKAARAFKRKLPFLFKVLAAGQPLSLQAHPSRQQAHNGFKRENQANVEKSSPQRNYKDKNHKPEILCALTPFSALYGFRPKSQVLSTLGQLHLKTLEPSIDQLRHDDDMGATGRFFLRLLSLEGDARSFVVEEIRSAIGRLDANPEVAETAEMSWIRKLLELYPTDVGVLAPLLMNLVELEPGQALYTEAGVLHSYLGGTGVELMANSDNVLRGGLTQKHVDRDELGRVLVVAELQPEILAPEPQRGEGGASVTLFETPAREFLLKKIEVASGESYESEAERYIEILLCTSGELEITCEDKTLTLKQGHSILASAAGGPYTLSGEGQIFVATVPEPTFVKPAPWELDEAEREASGSEADGDSEAEQETEPETG